MMDEAKRNALLRCVKKDDAKGFGKIVSPEILSAVFGRFPLLSLLYLYQAKRIVKRHFEELVKERPRLKEAPIREAEDRFRRVAGKSLRHFADREVSPLEMLAVLGKRRALRRLYAVYPHASRYLPSIHKIYFTRLGEGVTTLGDELILPREALSHAERVGGRRVACIALVLALLFAGTVGTVSGYFGIGTKNSFYKVRTDGALASALSHAQNISLEKDTSSSSSAKEYDAVFNGNDHVIRLKEPLVESFEGEMRDVTFILEEGFRGDAVILENKGTLTNVRVVAEDLSIDKGGEYMALLVADNQGEISDCHATVSASLSGDAGGDCYFAAIAGKNTGIIKNCSATGVLQGKNVDLAGIVGKNEKGGEVASCVVDLELCETSDIKGWTPNVAGIADHNGGSISDCEVKGVVKSLLVAPELTEEDRPASAYAGGIVCVNVGTILNCTNRASVTAEGTNGAAYAGGIVTLNTTLTDDPTASGSIEHSSSLNEVKALVHSAYNSCAGGIAALNDNGSLISSSRQTAFVYAESQDLLYRYIGGIAGKNYGGIQTSFFIGTLPERSDTTLVGEICGISYFYQSLFGQYLDMLNNAYVKTDYYGCGALQAANQNEAVVYSVEFIESQRAEALLDYGIYAATSLDELKALEIYYE